VVRHLLVTAILLLIVTGPAAGAELFLGQGTMSGEGTDPDALIKQLYTSPKPSGGFLFVAAGEKRVFDFRDDDGKSLYRITK